MRKMQQQMIGKAKRGGFRVEQVEELQREDLTINQLNHIFRFFCVVNYCKRRYDLDFSNLEPELISAVEGKDWERMHKIFDSAYEQLPKGTFEINDDKGSRIYSEICKIKEPNPDDGVLLVDLAVWFPYSNPEIIKLSFSLMSITDMYEHEEIANSSVINRRYPNKNYLTLSAKSGRKVCKAGFPVVMPRKRLNDFLFLEFIAGTVTQNMHFAVPILINTTKENPCASISINVNLFDNDLPIGVDIRHTTELTEDGGWIESCYSTAKDSEHIKPLYAHEVPLPDGRLRAMLSPGEDPDAGYDEGAIFALTPTPYSKVLCVF